MLTLSGTPAFTPFGEFMISSIHYRYTLQSWSVSGLCIYGVGQSQDYVYTELISLRTMYIQSWSVSGLCIYRVGQSQDYVHTELVSLRTMYIRSNHWFVDMNSLSQTYFIKY